MKETESFCPTSRQHWREWLQENHEKQPSVWLIQYKKHADHPSLSWSDAVDEALCFGWIDSTRRPIDEEKYMQFFSPRKTKSPWSKINKEKVERLIANKRMTPAGLKSIAIAKENGSWSMLDKAEALIIPEELEAAFAQHPGTKDFFLDQSKSTKKRILTWVLFAKRPETKEKRITEIVKNAEAGKIAPGLP